MTYTIGLDCFKRNGDPFYKEISRKTVKGLISAIKKFDENNDIHRVNGISPNLYDNKEFNDYIKTIGWQ